MQLDEMPIATGASRLFLQFLLVLVPVFTIISAVGLSYLAEHQTRLATSELAARLGSDLASTSRLLAEFTTFDDAHSIQHANDTLTRLLISKSVACAEIVRPDGSLVANAPLGLGCKGQEELELLSTPIRARDLVLNIRFNLDDIRWVQGEIATYTQIVLVAGMLLAIMASYLSFRILVGRPLRALSTAIRHTEMTGRHVDVRSRGRNELTAVINAYNDLQHKVMAEAALVRLRTSELEAEVAHRKRVEIELNAARRAAEASATKAEEVARTAETANRSKSVFLAMMSHELRTPLNSILGFSELLLRSTENPDKRSYVDFIHTSGKSLLAIINDLLDLSRIEAGDLDLTLAECSVHDVVESCCRLLSGKADEKQLNCSCHIADNVPEAVFTDADRLRQILINLLTNAIKFTREGSVQLHVGFTPIDAGSGQLRIDVTDTGVGIKSEALERIFARFYQEDSGMTRQHEGTGLGLAICSELTRLLGGEISVASVFGQGTTFTVILPVVLPLTGKVGAEPPFRLLAAG